MSNEAVYPWPLTKPDAIPRCLSNMGKQRHLAGLKKYWYGAAYSASTTVGQNK